MNVDVPLLVAFVRMSERLQHHGTTFRPDVRKLDARLRTSVGKLLLRALIDAGTVEPEIAAKAACIRRLARGNA